MALRGPRLEASLRLVGVIVWAVVGSPTWSKLLDQPLSLRSVVWIPLYLGFPWAFLKTTDSMRHASLRLRWLLLQALDASVLALIGMPHFEGGLMAVVAAEAPFLVKPKWALLWTLAQATILFAIVLPTHAVLGALKATGEYAAFSLFAMCVVYLREREADARRKLALANSGLIAAQSMLADGARTHERVKIAREIHDAIGHGLTAANVFLDVAARTTEGPPQEAVRKAQDAVRGMLSDVRGLVSSMHEQATIDLSAWRSGRFAPGSSNPRSSSRSRSTWRSKIPSGLTRSSAWCKKG
jgi:signal transduction histidine kinase